jgi:hypothetical protein
MEMRSKSAIAAVLLVGALAVAACGGDNGDEATENGGAGSSNLPQGSEPANLDPAEFTTEIDNPYWPMKVGSRWVYRETATDGTRQRVVVTVTDRTKRIANGVEARVVRDVVTEGGEPVEVTDDWYAQDSEGNVWYLGEATTEYENGKPVSSSGSFEAGKDGAEAGIIMPAQPEVGLSYRQEYYAGEAEDKASIFSLDQEVEVPFGHFTGVLMTRDVNPLEDPQAVEYKFFARGVGPLLAITVSGGDDREDLVSYTPGGSAPSGRVRGRRWRRVPDLVVHGLPKTALTAHPRQWSQRDSNPRPPGCKPDALPTELWPQPLRF